MAFHNSVFTPTPLFLAGITLIVLTSTNPKADATTIKTYGINLTGILCCGPLGKCSFGRYPIVGSTVALNSKKPGVTLAENTTDERGAFFISLPPGGLKDLKATLNVTAEAVGCDFFNNGPVVSHVKIIGANHTEKILKAETLGFKKAKGLDD